MLCQKCGREISNQARFCNHCGNPVSNTQAETPPQTSQYQMPPTSQTSSQAAPAKSKWGKRLLSGLVALGVFFLVRTVTYNALTKPSKTPAAEQTYGTATIAITDTSLTDAMSKCINGALYQDGYLRYGFARLSLSDYDLLPGEEEGERDYLLSSDGCSLFTASKQIEIMGASYEATTEEGILESSLSAFPDPRMIDFQKYQRDGVYVIRYIIRCTDSGTDMYYGELILMPSETCSETIRLSLFQTAETGYDRINQAFNSLSISADYAPDSSETNVFGYNRITAK